MAILRGRCKYTDVRERETHAHELLSRFMLNLTLTVKYENDEMISRVVGGNFATIF